MSVFFCSRVYTITCLQYPNIKQTLECTIKRIMPKYVFDQKTIRYVLIMKLAKKIIM